MNLSNGDILKLDRKLTKLKNDLIELEKVYSFVNCVEMSKTDMESVEKLLEIFKYKIAILENPEDFQELKDNFKLKKVLKEDVLFRN